MKNFFLFFYLFLFPVIFFAQASKKDSLLNFVKSAPDDTAKVNALNALYKEYRKASNTERAFYYAKQAKELSERIQLPGEKELGWPKGTASSLNGMGNMFSDEGNYNAALEYYSLSLAIRKKMKDRLGIGSLYNNIGLFAPR